MKYYLNESLLSQSKEAMKNRKNIYWIVGGSGSGKSTVCKAITQRYGLLYYDMDEYIFGKYIGRYTEEKHPANRAWFYADNPLNWALSFSSWEENNEFNLAATAEQLSLFCEDLEEVDKNQTIIVDGGITNPAILARVLDAQQICCIQIEEDHCIRIWENCEERQPMKKMIIQLPSPEGKWSKFLNANILMNRQMETECLDSKIKILFRGEETPVDHLVNVISTLLFENVL